MGIANVIAFVLHCNDLNSLSRSGATQQQLSGDSWRFAAAKNTRCRLLSQRTVRLVHFLLGLILFILQLNCILIILHVRTVEIQIVRTRCTRYILTTIRRERVSTTTTTITSYIGKSVTRFQTI